MHRWRTLVHTGKLRYKAGSNTLSSTTVRGFARSGGRGHDDEMGCNKGLWPHCQFSRMWLRQCPLNRPGRRDLTVARCRVREQADRLTTGYLAARCGGSCERDAPARGGTKRYGTDHPLPRRKHPDPSLATAMVRKLLPTDWSVRGATSLRHRTHRMRPATRADGPRSPGSDCR